MEGAADRRCNPHLPGLRVRGGGRDPPRDAIMIPRTISAERDVVLTSTSASSACGRSWGKRRARRGLRDWSAGAADRRSVALACEAWRGSLERRNAARLRPVQGLTTEHLGAVRGFWRVFACFWGRFLRSHFHGPRRAVRRGERCSAA